MKSLDGGRTFVTLDEAGGNGAPGHVDQHAIWIDPKNPKHLLIGNDGGFNVSWDQGRTWDFVNTMATATAYWVSADMRRPYYVYIGLQDNGSWGGPSATRSANGILNSDWFGIGGGDGFQTAVDPDRLQHRLHRVAGREHQPLRPAQRPRAEHPARVRRASAAADVAAAVAAGRGGAAPNVLNASRDRSIPLQLEHAVPALAAQPQHRLARRQPAVQVATIAATPGRRATTSPSRSIATPSRSWACRGTGRCCRRTTASSPTARSSRCRNHRSMPGVVWAGTDDGNVQVSRDGGMTFTEVGKNLPGLPRIISTGSRGSMRRTSTPATAYVSVDGHRSNDLKPYLFVTRDYGQKLGEHRRQSARVRHSSRWCAKIRATAICSTSAPSSVCIASADGGKTWNRFMNNLPTARVDDILVHPRDNDLIVATHARGVWIADDITALQQADQRGAGAGRDAVRHPSRRAVADRSPARPADRRPEGLRRGESAARHGHRLLPEVSAPTGDVKITITDGTGRVDPHARRHEAGRHQPGDLEPLARHRRRPAEAASAAAAAA